MEIQDILTLIQAVDEHKLTELKLDDGNVKLSLKKEEAPQIVNVTGGGYQSAPGWVAAGDPAAVPMAVSSSGAAAGVTGTDRAAVVSISGEAQNEAAGIGSDKVVNSPLVGTFYNSASPDADPFVKVGDTVKKGQVMGIIEAMKLMNEIESEYDGTIAEILVENGQAVEYGQPLFRVR